MDVAASEFFKDGKYDLDFKNPKNDGKMVRSGEQMINSTRVLREYSLISIEDPFDQDDWSSYKKLTDAVGKDVQMSETICLSQTQRG
jgi:enolase